jgi:hypothetical protein
MGAPTCFGITLPSSGSVPSASWEMLSWGAADRILWMDVLCLVTWCVRTFNVQLDVPAALPLVNCPRYPLSMRLGGPQPVWTFRREKNVCCCRESNLGSSSPSVVTLPNKGDAVAFQERTVLWLQTQPTASCLIRSHKNCHSVCWGAYA